MNQTTSEFECLLDRARTGDRTARGELLDSFRGYLMLLTQQFLDPRLGTRLDASDVIQQTWVTALGSFEQFRGVHQGEFVEWLKILHEHVMQNLAREHVRTKKRSVTREFHVTESQMALVDWAMQCSSPSQKLMKGEMAVRLAIALEKLAGDQREAVRLRYFEGCSLEQISQAMQRSKPAVAGLLKRGLVALRNEIA